MAFRARMEKLREAQSEEEAKNEKKSTPDIKSEEERVLESYKKASSKELGRGITRPSFVELEGDGKGVFKREDHKNERAAYLIDRFLNFGLVPPTVLRELDGVEGSLQRFIDGAKMGCELDMEKVSESAKIELMEMWIFDLIIGNPDRHAGNFLVREAKIYAIDNGMSFSRNMFSEEGEYDGLARRFTKEIDLGRSRGPVSFLGERLSEELVEKMREFLSKEHEQEILEELLAEILDEKTARACIKRIRCLADIIIKEGMIPSYMETVFI